MPIPTARDIMTSRVHTISSDAEIAVAVRQLLERGHSGAPVLDSSGAPCGILSEFDCIRVLAEAIAEAWPPGRVADHMTTQIETVAPHDDVLALAARFAEAGHRHLLVMEGGRLLGLISRRDLLGSLEQLEKHTSGSKRRSTYDVLEQRHRDLD